MSTPFPLSFVDQSSGTIKAQDQLKAGNVTPNVLYNVNSIDGLFSYGREYEFFVDRNENFQ